MTQADLQKALRAVDPAAVLVSPRILEGVIREEYRLPNMYWNIPHYKSYVCDRQCLFRHAEQADLEVEPDQLLPDTVILLARPDTEELSNLERKPLLLKYWRRLFHARIHLALNLKEQQGDLGHDAVEERIEEIGRTEFAEIRAVLTQDRYLPEGASDRTTYIEFAAVYLELRHFAGNLLPNYFPGIRDFGRIERLLARDVDAAAVFTTTRLEGAANPMQPLDSRPDESHEAYWKLVRQAKTATDEGNTVQAAILRMRASRIAPAAQTIPTRQEAEADIAHLCRRLAGALGLSERDREDWTRHLTLLLDKADQGAYTAETRVLDDLQRVCEDHEHEVFKVDLVEFLLSGGKRPIKRPLPSQRLVRTVKDLRSAVNRLSEVRLSDSDRSYLGRLLTDALNRAEEGLRTRFRPVLTTAMEDVGLRPATPIERAAFEQMVNELLDRISQYGFLTFAELRDTISRNQLKLPDLTDPEHFIRGDPLIRLDRRLGSLLDGVYRPGEFYVRWLERGASLLFGTSWGRPFTRFVLGPLLVAWLSLYVLGLLLQEGSQVYLGPDKEAIVHSVTWAWSSPKENIADSALALCLVQEPLSRRSEMPVFQAAQVLEGPLRMGRTSLDHPLLWHTAVLIPVYFFTLGLLHSELFRRRFLEALVGAWRGLRWAFFELPARFVPVATLRWLVSSWVFRLLYWYVIKPALFALVLLLLPPLRHNYYTIAATFLASAMVVNSRMGRGVSDAFWTLLGEMAGLIRAGLLPGLVRFIVQAFKQAVEVIEYVLFRIDEALRIRSGESGASLVVRSVLGALWFPVAYLIRFYMVVLIEPMLNPLKLPLSIVAAKFVYPLLAILGWFDLVTLTSPLVSPLYPSAWYWPANFLVATTFYLLPDAVAFLAWEMKENWGLYRANRSATVQPAAVGAHGETVRGLLSPGFHSGTIPRLYARIRLAERNATQTRNWNRARYLRHEIEEVAQGLQQFLSREMVAILRQSRAWKGQQVEAGSVSLATNRIRFEVNHAQHPKNPVQIEVELHHGWLMAGLRSTGWLETITPEQLRAFTACLAYFYKRAGVDLVREQLLREVPGPVTSLIPDKTELLVRVRTDHEPRRLPLASPDAISSHLTAVRSDPHLQSLNLVFAHTPLTWLQWVTAWECEQRGEQHPGLPGLGDNLLRQSGRLAMRPEDQTLVVADSPPGHGPMNEHTRLDGDDHEQEQAPEQRPEAQGEAERAGEEAAGSRAGVAGLRGQQVQE